MPTKAIGPTFAREIAAAGLSGLPFSWSADGSITFDVTMTSAQIAAVLAVYAAHDPTVPFLSNAQVAANAALAAGLHIICDSNSDISTTWALDDTTLSQIGSICFGIASGIGLPTGATIFPYGNKAGVPVYMSAAEFIRLYAAMRDYVARVTLYGASGFGSLPGQPVEIP
jgi:hypothetical protein